MPVLKSAPEKYIKGIKVDKENDTCFFNDETHSYYDKSTLKKYTSVTTLIHDYSQEFDSNFWSSYKALEALLDIETWSVLKPKLLSSKKIPKNLFSKINLDKNCFETKKNEILAEYDRKRIESCERGTKIHADFENSFYNKTDFDFTKFGCDAKGNFDCREGYYKLDLDRGVYPEFFISLESKDEILRISGQIDLLVIYDSDAYIIDWKSNKEIKKTSFFNKSKKSNEKMKYPLHHLDDCNWNHYQLQLSCYMYLLQQIRPDLNCKKLIIYHIDHDGKETIHECKYLKEEVEALFKHYKKRIKIQQELERVNPVKIG